MKEVKGMDVQELAYDFSVRIAEIVRYLKEEGQEFPLSGKLLDCGVGAGLAARKNSRKQAADCVKQADYILEMAQKSGYLTERQVKPTRGKGDALLRLLQGKAGTDD
ncbi:four helix bundle protein [Diplocloster modestus]|uniref:Uncharacterized protein n=1 Tax=Diplocloster modestus TaxID=2850322 RepID=A0ABS6K6R2_9FIRM|nr:four helix bundle protein [Diplocloster modestus]MBU9726226.1 hypothetical protein [Diplocloster modestus]